LRPRWAVLAVAALAGALAFAISRPGEEELVPPPAVAPARAEVKGVVERSPAAVPSAAAVRRAWRYARRRGGRVSFAVMDSEGRLRGRDARRQYVSASVVKAMLLVAELRRLRRDGLPLDPGTADLLRAMITFSDNDSADAVYARVGDAGLLEVAGAARMRRFTVAGHWTTSMVTAADLARLFSRVRRLVPRPHKAAALGMLRSVVGEQRWGIPRAAGASWTVHFKGGWRATGLGELVHQAAWLRDGNRRLAIAILTDAQPSRPYAIHTVRGVADRLLSG
jgi:beta-lactamase class A